MASAARSDVIHLERKGQKVTVTFLYLRRVHLIRCSLLATCKMISGGNHVLVVLRETISNRQRCRKNRTETFFERNV